MEDEITNYFVKKTVGEVLETLNEDQKKAVAYIISEIMNPKQVSQWEE